ncbi:hypothetical protein JIR23_08805 [Bradyrhizobium diazoefficiens]|nr:hypothetical protein [Bradyrhizobium diazoefficiens]QQN65767.1 hypothetical protein JIR23_08805 [Bradyrhizobium diazoefficiens]
MSSEESIDAATIIRQICRRSAAANHAALFINTRNDESTADNLREDSAASAVEILKVPFSRHPALTSQRAKLSMSQARCERCSDARNSISLAICTNFFI